MAVIKYVSFVQINQSDLKLHYVRGGSWLGDEFCSYMCSGVKNWRYWGN